MVKRSLIVIHRWLGVVFCLFFLIWFPSGIGMMYWDFPSVTAEDRLGRAPALDRRASFLPPAQALGLSAESEMPDDLRLSTLDARPVYRARFGRRQQTVDAESGDALNGISRDAMQRIASAWVGRAPSAATTEPIDVDQWTVEGSFRRLGPLWKYSWPGGEQVYVSARSGDVVQFTTRASRLGAYLGPIPHWLYFTPLRKHQEAWSRVVIWTSGISTVAALIGITIGVWMYSPRKGYRGETGATSIPYRGQKRWHMLFGLIFGVAAATWAFSGMLSMDPFPFSRAPRERGGVIQALRGRPQSAALSVSPGGILARLGTDRVKELEFTSIGGEPVYIAAMADGGTRIVALDGRISLAVDRDRIAAIVERAAGPAGIAETRVVTEYDWYYLDRHGSRPLPAILVRLSDADTTRYYIDPRTARIVGSYSARNWMSRWLYHALHSLDVPWLYRHRPAWDLVVITMMVGGTALGVTSLILAWRVVGRTVGLTS